MVNTRLFFDSRRPSKSGLYRMRLVVTKNGTMAVRALDVELSKEQWDGKEVINHPKSKFLNSFLNKKLVDFDTALKQLSITGQLVGKSAKEALLLAEELLDPSLKDAREAEERKAEIERNSISRFFSEFLNRKDNAGTKRLYLDTYNKLQAYCDSIGTDFSTLQFDGINKSWLNSFEVFCMTTESQNTASRHLRDIRAVYNAAIDDEVTTAYPFRKFKIKTEITVDKSYSAQELRELFTYNCYGGGQQEAVDMFKLTFFLIGINYVDLAGAGPAVKGRLNYRRAKTHKPYSIKLEPEALAIIKKYAGKDHLVNISERFANYKTYFNRVAKTLRKVGLVRVPGKTSTGKALLPDICMGAARTSWATIAQEELGIPRDEIAAALGHHTVDVTTTYLRTKWQKINDRNNRKVIDWVLYGIK